MSIHKNGILIVEETDPRELQDNLGEYLTIRSGDNGFFYNGKMDEIRIYNRVLTAHEVENLYELD
jgi:hypothetical protein